jgi:hypothetical protein
MKKRLIPSAPSPDFFVDAPEEIGPPPFAYIPVITRTLPAAGTIVRGLITLAGFGQALGDDPQPLEDMIGGRSRVRIKERKNEDDTDNKHVVKVEDACECVKDALNSELMTAKIMKMFLKGLIEGDVGSELQTLCDEIVECIRSKELRQDKPKVKDVALGYTRKEQG